MKDRILAWLYRLWGWLPMPDWLRGRIMRAGTAQDGLRTARRVVEIF